VRPSEVIVHSFGLGALSYLLKYEGRQPRIDVGAYHIPVVKARNAVTSA
jgi:hypothetical protein